MVNYAIKDIDPNPFRNIDRYPVSAEKVTALRTSLKSTGFWDNIVAREANGKAQIAYGHHRLIALQEEFGPDHEIDLIIRDLDDDTMLKMMAHENMDEWSATASVTHETIRSVVEAYAKGKITLPPPQKKTSAARIRHAPSFTLRDGAGARQHHPYTAQTVAEFIGWLTPKGKAQDKVTNALAALEFIERGVLTEDAFKDLSSKQAEAVVEETRRAKKKDDEIAARHRKEAEQAEKDAEAAKAAGDKEKAKSATRHARAAKKKEQARTAKAKNVAANVGGAVSRGMKKGAGVRDASSIAINAGARAKDKPSPCINDLSSKVATALHGILNSDKDGLVPKLEELVKLRDHLNAGARCDLVQNLKNVAKRATDYAARIDSGKPAKNVTAPEPKQLTDSRG